MLLAPGTHMGRVRREANILRSSSRKVPAKMYSRSGCGSGKGFRSTTLLAPTLDAIRAGRGRDSAHGSDPVRFFVENI